jgi:NHLM bacteriocin system ABC transporter ATP-binding protein
MTRQSTETEWNIFGEGAIEEVAGNKPFFLDDPTMAWLTLSGRVDVFGVAMENGEPVGARIHLLSAEPGQILFGMSLAPSAPLSIVAVGIAGSQVTRLARSKLQGLAQAPNDARRLAQAIDKWVDALSSSVARHCPASNLSLLQPGADISVPANKRLSPAHATLWISSTDAIVEFLERDEISLTTESGPFPLSASAWVTVPKKAHVSAVTTEAALQDGAVWTALERFQHIVVARTAANAREATAVERTRLHQILHDDQRVAAGTLSDLAAIVTPDQPAVDSGVLDQDSLLAACRLVGERIGVEIRAPGGDTANRSRNPLGAIAQASGVRIRRVLLRQTWWKEDNGPLLGFTTESRPVALLPTSPADYDCLDPETKSRVPVGAKQASRLQTGAYCFYRPFTSGRLNTREILACALTGTRRDWLSVGFIGLLGGVLGMLIPIVTGVIFGRIVPSGDRSNLVLVILALAVAAVVMAILQFTQDIAMLRIETRMDSLVEAALWDRLLKLPASFFRQFTAGDLAMRSMGIGRIRQILTETAISSLLSFLFSLVAFVLLFLYERRLAWLAVGLVLAVLVVTAITAAIQLRHARKCYRIGGKVAGIVLQILTGIARVRVAGAENRALAYWGQNYSQQMRLVFKAQSSANVLAALMAAVPALAALMIIAAASLLTPGSLSLGAFLAFNAAFVEIVAASVMLSATITSVVDLVPLYERALPIMKALPESHDGHRDPGTLNGEIELSHVSFRYDEDGPLVLDDINIRARPGEFVALVGPSGAGKSTILRLMLGFEAPTSGSIYFDREDLSGLDPQALRRQMGVVLQNSKLTPGDIFTNIAGSAGFTLDEVSEAARMSGLDKDLDQMPMGMYTVITEGGSTLSGGQRQRLMIARAVVSKPKILFFDEATSALDNVTQARVSKSLEDLKATRIVVAHRLSTVMKADMLYVIERGKIVQQGGYEDLLSQPGVFAELAKRQLT